MSKRKIINPDKVVLDITDPSGWTRENNPHPYYNISELGEDAWQHYYEFDDEGLFPVKCHRCLIRAPIGSGNCRDGGPYFQCMEEYLRKRKVKKTVQVTLDNGF